MHFKKKSQPARGLFRSRRNAREMAMQALYQWNITHDDIDTLKKQFEKKPEFALSDKIYFYNILDGVIADSELYTKISNYIKRYIDRPFSEIDPVELSILRIAAFELLAKTDIPYKVILNEALELTKRFGAALSHKFVNGVLDKIAREIRHRELIKLS